MLVSHEDYEAHPMLYEHYDLTVSSHEETALPSALAPVEELGAQELVFFLSPYLS